MKLPKTFPALCCVLLIVSCAPIHSRLQEIPIPPERILQNGYSLVPPDEKGWFVAGRDQYQLSLVKSGDGPDESFALQAILVKLPLFTSAEDLARFVKEGQAKDTDPKRYKMIKHDAKSRQQKGSDCAKSYFLVEDTAAVKRTTRAGSMMLEALSLTCAHPKNKNIGVNVTYSHRYYPEQKDSNFDEKAMLILNSIELSYP